MRELAEAHVADALGAHARDLWSARDPFARVPPPPDLAAQRAALEGSPWQRFALAAAFAARDPEAAMARTEAGFVALAVARAAIAARLGFADAWALFRAIHGEPDQALAPARPQLAPAPRTVEVALPDPQALAHRLAVAHGVDPRAITVELVDGDAPTPGRTYVIDPRRDVRVRLWRRPSSTGRGLLRVLLHELGHAILALHAEAPPPLVIDEGVAAWFTSLVERDAFVAELGLDPALAAAERATRAARRARLEEAALAERAYYRDGGPPPWQTPLAWRDPGASHSYAGAERVRDDLDHRLGDGWPTAPLAL